MQVFISYKREDVEFARRLYTSVQASDFTPWLDVVDLRPGDDWDTAIHQGMKNSEIVVGVLTSESLASRNVLDEWGYALSTGKRLFLLWLREVDEADIPPRYIRIQRIDMRHDEAAGMARLRAALLSTAKIVPVLIPAAETESVGEGSTPPRSATATPASTLQAPSTMPTTPESLPIFNENEPPALQAQQKTNRSRMLEKIKVFWVQGVLEQSIYGAALIELGLQPHTNAVANPWDTVLQHTMYGDYRLPMGTKISDIYHDLNGELLILGDPGSGKTTTLLELARDRIALAEQDESEPIPVVLNLSSWADDRSSLVKWLVSELNTKYAVPRKVAAAWVESDALLLLLDGLDEVLLRYRDQCVQAINDFRSEHGFTRMVVCSRIADYEALSTRLHLNGAIVLQPLNDTQIDGYLSNLGSEMQGVHEAMTTDPDLRKLAESPLMLSIMTLAFRGLRAADLPPLATVEAQRRRLFETYTRRMFERRPLHRETPEHVMHYLRWLAGRMVERKQSVFYIENLQVDWIAGDLPRRLYRIVGRGLFGAIIGAAVGALSGIALVVLYALVGNAYFQTISLNVWIAGAFAFVAAPAGVGTLVFAISGLQAYALDSIPDEFSPFGQMLRRISGVIAAGLSLGLVSVLVLGVGVFILALLLNAINPEYMSYHSSTYPSIGTTNLIRGWTALAIESAEISGLFLGAGAFTGAITTAVAIVVNVIRPRHRVLIGIVTLGLYGALIGLITLAIIWLVGVMFGGTLSAALIGDIVLTFAITCAFLAPVAYLLPKNWVVLPYILFCLALTGGLLIFDVVDSAIYRHSLGLQASGWIGVPLSLIVTAAIGYFIGRINDHIESAEALRWRWNWRWAVVGLVGAILLGLTLAVNVAADYSNWSETNELFYTETNIKSDQDALDSFNTPIAQANTEWTQDATDVPNFAAASDLIDQRTRLEIQLNTNPGFQQDFPGLDCQGYGNPSFLHFDLSEAELMQMQTQLNTINEQLKAYPAAEVDDWTNTRYVQIECQARADYTRSTILDMQRHHTLDGIKQEAVGVVRLALVLGIAFILGGGVIGGLRKTETIEIRTRPNSGIYRTLQTALRVMASFGLVGLVIGGLVGALLTTLPQGDIVMGADILSELVPVSMVVGLAIGVALGLLMGGSDAVVKHAVLRFFLRRNGSIPRNYAALLDDAANRILLRKVGGGYIFIHRYLLEYYASLDGQPDNPASTS